MISITVEPVLLFFMLAVYMQFPAFQELLYVKVCLSKYNSSICENLYLIENDEALDWTQNHSSYWSLGVTLIISIPAIFVSSFLGSWSDSFGRKIPMILPSIGAGLSAISYIIISLVDNISVYYILVGTFFIGICGGFSGCTMTTMSYLSDITSAGGRTPRVMVLEGMTFLGGTIGPFISALMLATVGRTYVFALIALFHIFVILYIVFILKQITRNLEEAEAAQGHGLINKYHMQQSFKSCFKQRENNKRKILLLYLLSMFIIIIVANGEMNIAYLYLKDKPFEWNSSKFSYFIGIKYGIGTILLIIGGPISVKLCMATDNILTQLGLLSRIAGLIVLGISSTDLDIWLVTIVGAGSYLSTPCLRSLMSKQIEKHELGKVFAFMSLLENVCLLLASAIFNIIYPLFRNINHSEYTFYFASILLILPIIFVWVAGASNGIKDADFNS